MTTKNVNIRITDELSKHLNQQTGVHGLYENTSEYIRDLIRHDIKDQKDAWGWLKSELEPALRADESEYINVPAKDVIARNKKNLQVKN